MAKFKNERWGLWLKVIIYVVVISFVVTIFYNWGGGGKMGSGVPENANWAAMVGEQAIPIQSFIYRYKMREQQYAQMFGDRFDPAQQQLAFGVINEMVQDKLAAMEAEKQGFYVSEEDISESILNIKDGEGNFVFRDKDGKFLGIDRYKYVLNYLNLTPELFEELQRTWILSDKLKEFFKSSIIVTDDDLMKEYKKRNERVSLDYILFDPSDDAKDLVLTDQDKKKYYDSHKEDFRTTEQRKAVFAFFRTDDLMNEAAVTEDEIRAYYDENLDTIYTKKDERRASHILFKTEAGKDKEAVRKKAEEVLAKAKAGEDFAALAKKHSEDSSASNGGDLGFFDRDQMVKPFSDAAFSIGVGEISDLVESQFGYHIIKVTDVRIAGIIPLEEAEQGIDRTLRRDKAAALAKKKADEFKTGLTSDNFETKMAEQNLKIWDTGYFEQSGAPANAGRVPAFNDEIFSLATGEVTGVHEAQNGCIVGKLMEIREPYIPEMAEIEAELSAEAKKDKLLRVAAEKAEQALKLASANGSLEEVAKKYDEDIVSAGFVNSNGWVKDLGQQEALFKDAFGLETGECGIYRVEGKGAIVYKVTEKKQVEEKTFQLEKDSLKDSILNEQFYNMYSGFMNKLTEESDVIINEEFINRVQGEPRKPV